MSTMLPSAIGMASCTQTWGASITITEKRGYQEDFYYYAQLLLSIVPALPIARYFQDSRVSVPVLLRKASLELLFVQCTSCHLLLSADADLVFSRSLS